ncbi:6947_t:CDS:10 [Entrophospora sp. SA101]|nr:6947_t:CDS:10 [Entrophospora sp. SA101]
MAKVKAIAAKLLVNASASTGENNIVQTHDNNIDLTSNTKTMNISTNNMNNADKNLNRLKRSHEDTYSSHEPRSTHDDDYRDDYRRDSYRGRERRYEDYGRDPKRAAYDGGVYPEYDSGSGVGGGGSRHRYGLGSEERRSLHNPHYGPGNDTRSMSVEEFKVPNAVVGLVIGRGGENLKRIEKTTGARIQFSQDQPPDVVERHVTVTGLADDVKVARVMIQQLVDDARNGTLVNRRDSNTPSNAAANATAAHGQNRNTVTVQIPSNKVGVVIGRGGETIRDLQDRSGARINVTPDSAASPQSNERPVTLIGDEAAIQRAKALIDEIVTNGDGVLKNNHHKDYRSNNYNSGTSAYNNEKSHGGGYGHYGSVPNDSVGLIIGKGGETVRALQQQSGAKIQIEPVHGVPPLERNVQIIGSAENISVAKSLILEKAASGNRERPSRNNNEHGKSGHQQNNYQKNNNYQQQSSYQQNGYQQGNYQQNTTSTNIASNNNNMGIYQQQTYPTATNVYPTQPQQNTTYVQGITSDYTQTPSTTYPASTTAYVTPSGQQATMAYTQYGQYNPNQSTTTTPYQYPTQPQYGGYGQAIQYAQPTAVQSTNQPTTQIAMQAVSQPATQQPTGQPQVNYYQTQIAPVDTTKVATTGADNKTDNAVAPASNYGYQTYPYNYNASSATATAIQYATAAGQNQTVYPITASTVAPYGSTTANTKAPTTNSATTPGTTDQSTQQNATATYTGYYAVDLSYPNSMPPPPSAPITSYAQQQQQYPPPPQQYPQSPQQYPQQPPQQYPQPYPQQKQSQPQQSPPLMPSLTNQFGNLNVTGQTQQYNFMSVNLINAPPIVKDLEAPPPPINMPSNSSVTQSDKANCDPSYKRSTLNAVPGTTSLLNKSRLPFGLIITPYRSLKEGEEPVPVITDAVIARCRRCRTYINPFVSFTDGGQKWGCNMCYLLNEVPPQFDWDIQTNQQADRWKRAELNHAVVEFVAPTEYMVRPPQPPVYLFVIDVSFPAIQSGAVATAARTILESLDRIPNEENRTKIGFITVDTSLHFYSLNSNASEPQMLVVSDLEDIFLPRPDDLLVNLKESRTVVEALLSRLGDTFKDTQIVNNALGSALLAAYKLISPIGGKIVVLQSSLPNINPGALKSREDPKSLGTPKESALLQPADNFYKKFAVDCSRSQICVEMFLLGSQYADVATLGRTEDALKFAHEFAEFLASPIALEAVMRVRASKGIHMTAFHGNFFVRQTDLLSLPNVPRDCSYAIELGIEENISSTTVCFQTALLHTTCFGERRIRVLTLALPVTNNVGELFSSADQVAIATLLANKAVDRSLTSKLEDARDALTNKIIDILGVYKSSVTGSQFGASPQLQISPNLKLLPLLALGLLKHVGTYGPDGTIIMPEPLNLSSEKIERHGAYLLEDGQNIFIWLGRQVVPQLCVDLLSVNSYEEVRTGKATLPLIDNPFSQRVNAIIGKTRESRRGVYYPHLYIVKEDGEPSLRLWFLSHIIEDRTDTVMSYPQWLAHLKDKVNSGSF